MDDSEESEESEESETSEDDQQDEEEEPPQASQPQRAQRLVAALATLRDYSTIPWSVVRAEIAEEHGMQQHALDMFKASFEQLVAQPPTPEHEPGTSEVLTREVLEQHSAGVMHSLLFSRFVAQTEDSVDLVTFVRAMCALSPEVGTEVRLEWLFDLLSQGKPVLTAADIAPGTTGPLAHGKSASSVHDAASKALDAIGGAGGELSRQAFVAYFAEHYPDAPLLCVDCESRPPVSRDMNLVLNVLAAHDVKPDLKSCNLVFGALSRGLARQRIPLVRLPHALLLFFLLLKATSPSQDVNVLGAVAAKIDDLEDILSGQHVHFPAREELAFLTAWVRDVLDVYRNQRSGPSIGRVGLSRAEFGALFLVQ